MTIDPKFLTGIGAALSIFLCSAGAALPSAHGGIYALRRNHVKALIPVVQAGILAIYGIIVGIILTGNMGEDITQEEGYRYLAAGLSVGLACLASGWGMALFLRMVNEESMVHKEQDSAAGSDSAAQSAPLIPGRAGGVATFPPSNFKIFILTLVFLEAIGMYGLIVAVVLMG